MTSSPRFTAESLKRKTKGFLAVVIDNNHPSGASSVSVQYFPTLEAAKIEAERLNARAKVTA